MSAMKYAPSKSANNETEKLYRTVATVSTPWWL
jgi:hypothetical protein